MTIAPEILKEAHQHVPQVLYVDSHAGSDTAAGDVLCPSGEGYRGFGECFVDSVIFQHVWERVP